VAEQPAKARVISAIVNVTKQFLDDPGPRGVMSWLQQRVTELYLIAEDDQFLNGDGTSSNLTGISDAGNFTAATSLPRIMILCNL
jgi:HK97 family phage major capsid protein